MSDEFVHDLFERLARYTTQAGYALEPRVEPILLMYLPELLTQLRGGEYLVVTPQFPIHNLHNFRVGNAADALVLRRPDEHQTGAWLITEIKTDVNSMRFEQVQAYADAAGRGMATLVGRLRLAAQRPGMSRVVRAKYAQVVNAVHPFEPHFGWPIELLYLVPWRRHEGHIASLANERNPDVEVDVIAFEDLGVVELERYAAEWKLFREMVVPAIVQTQFH